MRGQLLIKFQKPHSTTQTIQQFGSIKKFLRKHFFGTDKNTDRAVYAFNLDGKIIEDKTIRGLKRPNNVDIRYDFKLNDSTRVDAMAFIKREGAFIVSNQQAETFNVFSRKDNTFITEIN